MRHQVFHSKTKIVALKWSKEGNNILSLSTGQLCLFDAVSGGLISSIHTRSSWIMACDLSPSGRFGIAGGLDNICSIYSLELRNGLLCKEFSGHVGYVGACRFLNDEQILSGSGDYSCILWDVETGFLARFPLERGSGQSDIVGLSVNPSTRTTFVGACSDFGAVLWDLRSKTYERNYPHAAPVNTVEYCLSKNHLCFRFLHNGTTFLTGADDGICRLFDIRMNSPLMSYESSMAGVTSVAFSLSGRLAVAAFDNGDCCIFDVLDGTIRQSISHPRRVSSVGVCADGSAIATGCWDCSLRVSSFSFPYK